MFGFKSNKINFLDTGKGIREMFFAIDEGSCNVPDITSKVSEGFEGELTLVNANCLRVEDSVATRGKFNLDLSNWVFNFSRIFF